MNTIIDLATELETIFSDPATAEKLNALHAQINTAKAALEVLPGANPSHLVMARNHALNAISLAGNTAINLGHVLKWAKSHAALPNPIPGSATVPAAPTGVPPATSTIAPPSTT